MAMVNAKKPFLGGTSNCRQGDPYGMFRRGSKPFHRHDHNCCSVLREAEFLMVASIPGLGICNFKTHNVPRFNTRTPFSDQRFGGLTLSSLVRKVSMDPGFNGHFSLWMRDNDGDHIYHCRSYPDLGMGEYISMLSEVFRSAKNIVSRG